MQVPGYRSTQAIPLGHLHMIALTRTHIVLMDIVNGLVFLSLSYWPVANRIRFSSTELLPVVKTLREPPLACRRPKRAMTTV